MDSVLTVLAMNDCEDLPSLPRRLRRPLDLFFRPRMVLVPPTPARAADVPASELVIPGLTVDAVTVEASPSEFDDDADDLLRLSLSPTKFAA